MRKKIIITSVICLLIVVFIGFISGRMELLIGRLYEDKYLAPEKALYWYTRAAEKGNAEAEHQLGLIYRYGRGVEIDLKEAFNWHTEAANHGDRYAPLTLGLMYAKGEGVEKDYREAIKWLVVFNWRKPELGIKPSSFDSIVGRPNMFGVVNDSGNSNSFLKDDEDRLVWLELCAKRGDGDIEAYFKLGHTYYYGKGVEQDYRKAFEWYNKGSREDFDRNKKGNGGFLVSIDELSERECKQLAEYLQRKNGKNGAEDGSAYHQYWIGLQNYRGEIISKNYKDAKEWFIKAAMHEKSGAKFYYGSIADARFYLGQMYENGEGVIEDYIEAYKWYLLAGMIPSNDTDCIKAKKSLSGKMSQEQIAEAQRMAKEFIVN